MFSLKTSSTLPRLRRARPTINLRSFADDSGLAKPFNKILIANRGEIACRVMTTAKRLGIKTVAVYSDVESQARHVQMADEAYCIGPAPSAQSYLQIPRICEVIKKTGAEAVHPGYGFLSENSAFCAAIDELGVAFIGPPASAIDAMGDKITSKQIAMDAGVNTIPGFQDIIKDEEEAVKIARQVGYPVMIKATAGGGGKGMRISFSDEETREGFRLSTEEARSSFGDDRMFIEKFIEEPHHIEIQLVADDHGKVVCFPERECSIQRRNQKVLEESPSPFIKPETRAKMCEQATMLAKAVGYRSAGTIEFLADKHQNFYFLEMNTRLQVEHPVTEYVGQVDLVEEMLRVAAKQPISAHLSTEQASKNIHGWALEARVYAEDPLRSFLPSNGSLLTLVEPDGATAFESLGGTPVRVDSGLMEGFEISTHYDPMIAKLITHGSNRKECIDRMEKALDEYVITGSESLAHNVNFLSALCRHPRFREGDTPTSFIEEEFPDGFYGSILSAPEINRTIAAAAIIHAASNKKNNTQEPVVVTLSDDGHGGSIRLSLGEHGYRSFHVDSSSSTYGGDLALRITPLDRASGEEVAAEAVTVTLAAAEVAAMTKHCNRLAVDLVGDGHGSQVIQSRGPTPGNMCAFAFGVAGAGVNATVLSPKEHEYSRYMLEPEVKDTSNMIQSPMPGTLISVSVEEGQSIEAGQEVAVVEAMKMQNVLRAPRAGIVQEVHCAPGASLKVDQLIASLVAPDADDLVA